MNKQDIIVILNDICKYSKMGFRGYLIGGTALTIHEIQKNTKDIDIIFQTFDDRRNFINAAKEAGFKWSDEVVEVALKTDSEKAVQISKDNIIIDLFVKVTTHFCLTKSIEERAKLILQTHGGAKMYGLSPQDILIYKAATGRKSDIIVANNIINSFNVNWEIVLNEIENQHFEGMNRATYDFLELIQEENIYKLIPNNVLIKLFSILDTRIVKLKQNCQIIV